MPSAEHDQLVLLFRNRPALAAELLGAATGRALPRFTEARLANVDQTEMPQATRLADAVVQLHDGERTVGAVVVEVQLSKSPRKRFTWPLYVASVRAELQGAPGRTATRSHGRCSRVWAASTPSWRRSIVPSSCRRSARP